MNSSGSSCGPRWFVDARPAATTDHMSLDLARHLPRRLSVGPAIIVTDRPAVLLSVVRKRWVKIIREVIRQRASTLDPQKKAGLARELEHLQTCRFTVKTFKQSPTADCFFVSPAQLGKGLPPCYPTLYVTTWLSAKGLLDAASNLPLSGLIVAYGEWPPEYEKVLRAAFHARLAQYGAGKYPDSQAPL
jgi:hypothetical protein